jgi:hypothetical protein
MVVQSGPLMMAGTSTSTQRDGSAGACAVRRPTELTAIEIIADKDFTL